MKAFPKSETGYTLKHVNKWVGLAPALTDKSLLNMWRIYEQYKETLKTIQTELKIQKE